MIVALIMVEDRGDVDAEDCFGKKGGKNDR